MSLEQKKEAIFRVLEILWNGKGTQDEESERFTLEDIVGELDEEYGIRLERKAVIRDIALLRTLGFKIETTHQGSRLVSRPIEDAELCFLIDSVRASRDLTDDDKNDLIQKLGRLSSATFRERQHKRDLGSGERRRGRSDVIRNVALVNQAIASGDQVEYDYCLFGTDGELNRVASFKVSPYSLLQHNQRYYLMGYDLAGKHMIYHRMNRIVNLKRIKSDGSGQQLRNVKGFERGIDPRLFDYQMPYLYAEKPERVKIRAKLFVMDQIVDWFGDDLKTEDNGDGTVTVEVYSNPTAMCYWALQFAESVEVVSPPLIVKKIREILTHASDVYRINRSE